MQKCGNQAIIYIYLFISCTQIQNIIPNSLEIDESARISIQLTYYAQKQIK